MNTLGNIRTQTMAANNFCKPTGCFIRRSAPPASPLPIESSAHMYMTSLHVSLTPPSFLIRLAPSGAPIYTGIVASPCTSPRQRTGAPPHSNESVRPQALLHQASFLLVAMQSRHAHATTMHMPQPAPSICFLRPAHVACGHIIHGSCSIHA